MFMILFSSAKAASAKTQKINTIARAKNNRQPLFIASPLKRQFPLISFTDWYLYYDSQLTQALLFDRYIANKFLLPARPPPYSSPSITSP
ncbi:hypothetical protein [Methylomicrobium lacus]|uniref:hypothetical protein n=1 Tax=Methylomicrobium lacus TaxID=136992 RepID=UPI0018E07ACB|nr:hypothetical protein [Methylomicrobium lacus]